MDEYDKVLQGRLNRAAWRWNLIIMVLSFFGLLAYRHWIGPIPVLTHTWPVNISLPWNLHFSHWFDVVLFGLAANLIVRLIFDDIQNFVCDKYGLITSMVMYPAVAIFLIINGWAQLVIISGMAIFSFLIALFVCLVIVSVVVWITIFGIEMMIKTIIAAFKKMVMMIKFLSLCALCVAVLAFFLFWAIGEKIGDYCRPPWRWLNGGAFREI
jgi:hypothetical protein